MVSEWIISTITCYFHSEFVAIPYAALSTVCVLQCTMYNTKVGTPCTWASGALPVEWGSLANHGATVSVGKFERLLQLVLLRFGDPRALFGCTVPPTNNLPNIRAFSRIFANFANIRENSWKFEIFFFFFFFFFFFYFFFFSFSFYSIDLCLILFYSCRSLLIVCKSCDCTLIK